MKTTFLRVLEADDKAAALLAAIHDPAAPQGKHRFEVDPASFASVPRSPFAYWVSKGLRLIFAELAPFEAEGRTVKQGLATTDDFRFVRAWWEVPPINVRQRWYPFAKGGKFSRFYSDVSLMVNWASGGIELYVFNGIPFGTSGAPMRNPGYYFHPGLTWPRRTQSGLALRVMPAGCIFADKGPAAFVANDNCQQLLSLLAIANAASFRALVDLQMAFGSYEVGVIQRTPVPNLSESDEGVLATLARRAWSLKRSLDTANETSHAFALPALLQTEGDSLADRVGGWLERARNVEVEIADIQAEIDERCFDLYGIHQADRRAITEGFGTMTGEDSDSSDDTDDEDDSTASADAASLTADLVSWAVGVACGRFDVRLATGEHALPSEPEPFEPLPVCSPGMLTGGDNLPLSTAPAGYPITFPESGLRVDDPSRPDDLTAAVRAVFDVAFGEDADARWQEAATLLDPRRRDLRAWLGRSFFEHHLRQYSKSRRKAPIYWPLSTPSGSYTVWVYYPRLGHDTLYRVLNNLVEPKLAQVEGEIVQLEREQSATGGGHAAKHAKHIADLIDLREELQAMRDELRRVAEFPYRPDLNDGVQISAAPLWRLFQHKPWRKVLEQTWKDLQAGKYEWAHLALAIWPDRVRAACKTDRSLAIAHDLEELYEGNKQSAQATRRGRRKAASSTGTLSGLALERNDAAE